MALVQLAADAFATSTPGVERDHSDQVSRSVHGPENNNHVGRFGFVRRQGGRILILPNGKVDHLADLDFLFYRFHRLHDVEPVAVEEERVIAV